MTVERLIEFLNLVEDKKSEVWAHVINDETYQNVTDVGLGHYNDRIVVDITVEVEER